MYQNKKKTIITEEIINEFIKMVRDTLKNSICSFDFVDDMELEYALILHTSDGTKFGCTDGELFILDSDFFYRRFFDRWCSHRIFICNKIEIPSHFEFFQKLYNKNVLTHRYFSDEPLHKFHIYSNSSKSFFCIEAERLGIYDGMHLTLSF